MQRVKIPNIWFKTIIKKHQYGSVLYVHYVNKQINKDNKTHNVYVYPSFIYKIIITLLLPLYILVGGFSEVLVEYKKAMKNHCSAFEINSALAETLFRICER